jgi:hypothetical protein
MTTTATPSATSFKDAQWESSFVVDGVPGGPIALQQVDRKHFRLLSRIDYVGAETGLEDKVSAATLEEIRYVTPEHLAEGTDLASVPGPLRWFSGSYGSHTPAALIHDRFIGGTKPADLTDQHVDRYFRFMLHATGVRWLKRWLMWAAVALRTRSVSGGGKLVSVIAWMLGLIAAYVVACIGIGPGSGWLIAAGLLAPFPLTILWGRQYGAGLVMAYTLPFLIPPAIVAVLGYGVYLIIEGIATLLLPEDTAGTDTFKLQV